MRPRLLLLDEPLASLDAARKREILPYLVRLRDEAHVPMVYVSHQAGELRRIATTVVRLDGGRVHGRPAASSCSIRPISTRSEHDMIESRACSRPSASSA